jgi:hypothetical protein
MTTPVEDCDVQSKYEMCGAVSEGWDGAGADEGRAVEAGVAVMQHCWLHTTACTQFEALLLLLLGGFVGLAESCCGCVR